MNFGNDSIAAVPVQFERHTTLAIRRRKTVRVVVHHVPIALMIVGVL
jgi:hypothetical protein